MKRIHPGLPWPPPPLPRAFRADQPEGDTPHFWAGGPVTVRPLPAPRLVRLRNGKRIAATHEVPWFLDRVEGVDRRKAVKRLYDVFLDPHGWVQTGVHFRRVATRAEATLLVRVIPQDTTVCGKGSAGCFSYGFEPDGKPVAEMGVEAIDQDNPWHTVTGMEVCGHGAFKIDDGYTQQHQPYIGVMGNWEACAQVGYRPTRAEIAAAKQWLAGTLDTALVHH
jgi:hypothetical protein